MTDSPIKASGRHVDPRIVSPSRNGLAGLRLRSRGAVATVVVGGVVAALLVGHDVALGSSSGNLASDTFARTIRSGWGTAANGGAWTTSSGGPTFTVAKHTGRMTLRTAGHPVATLKSVHSSRTDLLVSVRASKAPTGGGTFVWANGRVPRSGGYYAARVHLRKDGTVGVALVRRSASGAEKVIRREVTAPGVTARAGATTSVRVDVLGSSPTIVRARAWTSGQREPSTWLVAAKDGTAALQTSGAIGVSGSLARNTTNAPVVLSFTRVIASSINAARTTSTRTTTSSPAPASPPVPKTKFSSSTAGAGSASLGATSYAVPAGAVFLATSGSDANPGTAARPVATLAHALAITKAGGTVVVRGGTYHQGSAAISRPVTVQSYPGEAVWFDGSRSFTGFTANGSIWSAPYAYVFDHSPTYSSGAADNSAQFWAFVNKAYPMASHPDMVWVNGVELRQVGSVGAVTAGTFFVDPASHQLYVGSNPIGGNVRVSDLQQFLRVSSPGVTLRGFGVRRYADSVPQMGALVVYGKGTRLENIFVNDNATQGIGIGATSPTVTHVTATGNGMLGIQASYADGILVDHVVSTGNNDEHFNYSPVSGGVKIARTRGIVVRNSVLSNNFGQGVWCDESSYNITIVDNDTTGNSAAGIVIELSDTGTIANNLSTDNGDGGIKLQNAGHFQVWNNTAIRNNRDIFIVQDYRLQSNLSLAGHDPRQKLPDMSVPWQAYYITIRNNVIENSTGSALLDVEDYTKALSGAAMHINTAHNAYVRASGASPARLVAWSAGGGKSASGFNTLAAFQAATGQESGSVFAYSAAALPVMTPESIPASIAPLVGQAAGARHLGAWR